MPRRRTPREIKELTVEAIVWKDAQRKTMEAFEPELPVRMAYGAVVHEDEEKVVLANDHEYTPELMNEEMDFTKIPKGMIVKRKVLGAVRLEGDEL